MTKPADGPRPAGTEETPEASGPVDPVILLVEDDPDHQLLMRRGLERGQIPNQVVVAGDGVEAMDYLFGTGSYEGRDATVLPAVVLLDLNLPRVGGLEVLRRLRGDERTRGLPVVIMTSSDEDRDIVRGYSLGVNSYVRKTASAIPTVVRIVRTAVQRI